MSMPPARRASRISGAQRLGRHGISARDATRGRASEALRPSVLPLLHRSGNQMYQGLLDWRLGLAYLRCLDDSSFDCGLERDSFSDPSLADWPRLCRE